MDCLDHKKTLIFTLLCHNLFAGYNVRLHFRRQRMPLMIERRDNVYYLSSFDRVNRALKIVWMLEIWEFDGNLFPIAASQLNADSVGINWVAHVSQSELCQFAGQFLESLADFLPPLTD